MINVVINPNAIELPAGAVLRVPGTWQDYQALLEHLGDHTYPRVKYCNGEVLLMVPLPEHGKQLDIVADMVKVLLRHQGLRFDSYPETTMVLPEQGGITPDHFFYIDELPVVGQRRKIKRSLSSSIHLAEAESKFQAMHETVMGNTVVENAKITVIEISPDLQIAPVMRSWE